MKDSERIAIRFGSFYFNCYVAGTLARTAKALTILGRHDNAVLTGVTKFTNKSVNRLTTVKEMFTLN